MHWNSWLCIFFILFSNGSFIGSLDPGLCLSFPRKRIIDCYDCIVNHTQTSHAVLRPIYSDEARLWLLPMSAGFEILDFCLNKCETLNALQMVNCLNLTAVKPHVVQLLSERKVHRAHPQYSYCIYSGLPEQDYEAFNCLSRYGEVSRSMVYYSGDKHRLLYINTKESIGDVILHCLNQHPHIRLDLLKHAYLCQLADPLTPEPRQRTQPSSHLYYHILQCSPN